MHTLTRLARALILALMPVAAFAASAQSSDTPALQSWHDSIAAGYQTLATDAAEFQSAARAYCSEPDSDTRAEVNQAWLDAFLAWQGVRFVDFGPVEQDNLAWQFQFWPDPKNLIAKKARFLLRSDQSVTPAVIRESGVAVQGFPMAEYLLFDQPFNAGDRALPAGKTCEFLGTLAGYITANSDTLHQQWQAFGTHYLGSAQYQEATIRSAMTALEILEERRLAQPMGLRGNGKRSVYAADAWRSGTSLNTVRATVAGLQAHFLPGLSRLLKQNDQAQLAGRIEQQFAKVLGHFPALDAPMAPMLADDDRFAALQGFYVDVSQLVTMINDQAAIELGVVRGFNSSDGD